MSGFNLQWEAGATAQLELVTPEPADPTSSAYELKYTPAMRSTLRPPPQVRHLGTDDLSHISNELTKVFDRFVSASTGRSGQASVDAAEVDCSVTETMTRLGKQLFRLLVPANVRSELAAESLFLEIGIDEKLVDYPWELMHDGRDFLCAHHYVGRFVNVAVPPPLPMNDGAASPKSDRLRVLIISVPRPLPRADGVTYDVLPGAEAETEELSELLSGMGWVDVTLLKGRDADFDDVWQALENNDYHIVHYTGHAHFNEARPHLSALVLNDRDMATGPLVSFFGTTPPMLFFVNGCETGRAGTWKEHYNMFGLARAFLETGSYLLGSRWRISDTVARRFANAFYTSLLQVGKPVGQAVMEARHACRQEVPADDCNWASYVYYGDPRVSFQKNGAV